MGYENEAYLYLLFHYTGKKRYSREDTKNPNTSKSKRHILDCGVSFPPEFQLAFHIYYVKYENTLTCKRISWNSGGGGMMFKKYFSISYMYNTKSDHFNPK